MTVRESEDGEDMTGELPQPAAAVTFTPDLREDDARAVGSAHVLETGYVARSLIRIFKRNPSLKRIRATIGVGGEWSSPVPGVADLLNLVFGPAYRPTASYDPRGLSVVTAENVAEALPPTTFEDLTDRPVPKADINF